MWRFLLDIITDMKQQWVGLLDCNNFFVSCERLFRPDLENKPVAVLSSNDGCIVASSQEIKDMEIPMGVPYFQVKDILKTNNAVVFSGNHRLYRTISKRVFATMETVQNPIEQYSVDEAFFYFFGTEEEARQQILMIKETVEKEVGVPVSVGISLSKTLAKVANEMNKKTTGLKLLDFEEWSQINLSYPLASIWGIGRNFSKRLREDGLISVSDFLAADPGRVRRLYGVVGERIRQELQGISVLSAKNRELKQSIMSSRSFGKETIALSVLEEAISYHVEQVSYDLRQAGACATKVAVFISPSRHGDFVLQSRYGERDFLAPISTTRDIGVIAIQLLRELYVTGVPYKKAGVRVSGIQPFAVQQLSLFTPVAKKIPDPLQSTIDVVNRRFKTGRIHQGFLEGARKYSAIANQQSPAYTTSWGELPVVKA